MENTLYVGLRHLPEFGLTALEAISVRDNKRLELKKIGSFAVYGQLCTASFSQAHGSVRVFDPKPMDGLLWMSEDRFCADTIDT